MNEEPCCCGNWLP